MMRQGYPYITRTGQCLINLVLMRIYSADTSFASLLLTSMQAEFEHLLQSRERMEGFRKRTELQRAQQAAQQVRGFDDARAAISIRSTSDDAGIRWPPLMPAAPMLM